MPNRKLMNGLFLFVAGLLFSSLSSFLGDLMILGEATRIVQGVLDGVATVLYAGAIFFMVRGRKGG